MKIKFCGDEEETHIFKLKVRCKACGFADQIKTNNPLFLLKIIFFINMIGKCSNCGLGAGK